MGNAFQEAVFWALAVVTVGGAVLVVTQRDMLRAALALIVSFLGAAGLYAQMNAAFVAAAQVLIYGGAVSVLVIFAVMMTRDVPAANRGSSVQPAALAVVALLFTGLAWAIAQAEWTLLPETLPGPLEAVFVDSASTLGTLLLTDYVLAFEAVGVLLLAAVIGALALVRER